MALLTNLRQVHIANPISLLAGAKQGEKEPRASWLLTVIGLLCLGGGYFLALYYTSPLEVIMIFLAAVALVIIGTYCLFTSGSIALLKLLRKNKRYYYQPGHFISVSGMIYRMKQNAAGLATICILSCMVLVTVASTVSLNVGAEDSLETQYPYEYQLRFGDVRDADTLRAMAEDSARASGVALTNVQDYTKAGFMANAHGSVFTATANDASIRTITNISLLALDEYNLNEGTKVQLAEGEALLLATGGNYGQDELTLDGISYRLQHLESLGKATRGSRDIGRTLTLVLPGQAAIDAALLASGLEVTPSRTLAFDLAGDEAAKQAFYAHYYAGFEGLSTEGYFHISSRDGARESWYASNGGFLFLGICFGVLFMLAAALIIYYKQLSEGYDDAERFEILQKVGMGEAEVKHTINRQILAVFFLPLLVAVVHVVVAFFPISRAMIVFGVLNVPLLAVTGLLTILAYALVYLLVFRQTARTYFGIVKRQAAST